MFYDIYMIDQSDHEANVSFSLIICRELHGKNKRLLTSLWDLDHLRGMNCLHYDPYNSHERSFRLQNGLDFQHDQLLIGQ